MEEVKINWVRGVTELAQVPQSDKPQFLTTGFYAVIGGKFDYDSKTYLDMSVLLIGKAEDKPLRETILARPPGFTAVEKWLNDRPGYAALIMIGLRERSMYTPMGLYDDVVRLLTRDNAPLCAEKVDGVPRAMRITNAGDYQPLKEISQAPGA